MDYEIEVTTKDGKEVVAVSAPNQRDAHLLAAREVTGEMEPPPGTGTRIISPTGGVRIF